MDSYYPTQRLTLKPSRKKGLIKQLLVLGFFIVMWLFAFQVVQHPLTQASGPASLKLYYGCWLILVIFPLIIVSFIIQLLPKFGTVYLTPEGFEIQRLFRKRFYHWRDVTGFYEFPIPISQSNLTMICFDLAGQASTKLRKVLMASQYELSPSEMVAVLNQWKQQYAPKPENIELKPLVVPPLIKTLFGSKISILIWAQVIGVVFTLLSIFCNYWFFSKTAIKLVNNSRYPISSLSIQSYSLFPQHHEAFQISTLQPNQEAWVEIPHFDQGHLRIAYTSAQGDSCAYMRHTQCAWHSGETIFLEPYGRFGFKLNYCEPKKDLGEADRIIGGMCNLVDPQVAKQGFYKISATEITPMQASSPVYFTPKNTQSYIHNLQAEVAKHWHPPHYGKNTSITALFSILRNGDIQDIQISQPSGNKQLDESCIEAIENASPLPPLPASEKNTQIKSKFIFDYVTRH